MQSQKPVRTYLDPDTVGPLPRSYADDSDALSAARTIELPPPVRTIELAPGDVLEIFDPRRPRHPSSLAPVGYDQPAARPRRRLGNVVMGVVIAASVIIAIAAVRGTSRSGEQTGSSAAAARLQVTAAAAALPSPVVVPSSVAAAASTAPPTASETSASRTAPASETPVVAAGAVVDLSTVGTIRVDRRAEGHRVWVDDFVLTADAAMVRCGPHRVKVGSLGPTRTVEVPCGGDITVFR